MYDNEGRIRVKSYRRTRYEFGVLFIKVGYRDYSMMCFIFQ